MIIVMPNGRAQKNDRAEENVFANGHEPARWRNNLWPFSQRIFK